MPQEAVIDNDFLQHLAETNGSPEDVCRMIQAFFQELDVSPLLHEYVYGNEVNQGHSVIRKLIDEREAIKIARLFGDVLKSAPAQRTYYELLVKQIYQSFTGKPYPCKVFGEWIRGKSLGETHCVVMCLFMNLACFLSDDRDAKSLREIIKGQSAHEIEILSREDCRRQIKDNLHILQRDDLRKLCHKP